MLLYHLDRYGTLENGQAISLSPLTYLHPEIQNSHFVQYFSDGISSHGMNYLKNSCPYLETKPVSIYENGITQQVDFCSARSIQQQKQSIDSGLIEFTFELVRRAYFPSCPSRYVSFFAVASTDEFSKWPELVSSPKARIFSFESSASPPRFDANWLRGGLIFGSNNGQCYLGLLPWAMVDYAIKYWSGIPSDSPRWEYLAPLPIQKIQLLGVDL